MPSPLGKNKSSFQPAIRDTLFGDETLERVAAYSSGPSDPSCWSHFAAAQQLVKKGDKIAAVHELNKVLEATGQESRACLQAWSCLRALGQVPPAHVASEIRGVVVEVALEEGLDLLAAYSDHSARYHNYSGASVLWDASDPSIDRIIDDLLAAGQEIIGQIGLWDKPRPPAPAKGSVRINLLTYGGLYFGQGGYDVLMQDRLGGPALGIATSLMQALIATSRA